MVYRLVGSEVATALKAPLILMFKVCLSYSCLVFAIFVHRITGDFFFCFTHQQTLELEVTEVKCLVCQIYTIYRIHVI